MQDITFHSAALNRDMQYRVILPANLAAGQKLPVVYLLHGRGGNFRDWSNYSDVARAKRALVGVSMGGFGAVIADVKARFPAVTGTSGRFSETRKVKPAAKTILSS